MLVCVIVFVLAGIWQLQRGQTKASMLTQREAASKAPARAFLPALAEQQETLDTLYGKKYKARGHYDSAHQILQDNQVFAGRAGYHVWTPLILADGRRLLVDRGWISRGTGGRAQPPVPPAPSGLMAVQGRFRALPEPGLRLGQPPPCKPTTWPRILNYPTIETVRCLYPAAVINGLLLLDEDAAHGFERNWQLDIGGMSPARHYAYAAQWFALAAAVIVVFFVVNMKRIR